MSSTLTNTATGKTTQTFLTALVSNSLLLAVEVIAFVFLKKKLSRLYTPRVYLPPPEKRAVPLPDGAWKWLPAVAITPPEEIIGKNGLDAYMFLRTLRLMIMIFGTFTIITWTVLLPINTVGVKGVATDGLNKLSWGNIPPNDFTRYAAHIVVVYLLTFWVIYLIRLEYIHYTQMRQGYLASKSHSHIPKSRTVLITAIPHEMCTKKELRIWGAFIPGGIQNIWIYRDTRELNKAFEERLKACEQLEAAVSKLLRLAVLEWRKRLQMRNAEELYRFTQPPGSLEGMEVDAVPTLSGYSTIHQRSILQSLTGVPSDLEWGSTYVSQLPDPRGLLNDLVPRSKRPSHRLGVLGLWGRKVDTYKHYKHTISQLNITIDTLRQRSHTAKPLGSAFIQCNLQMGAQVLAQCVSHHQPMKMYYKWIQVAPKDVIWANIDDGVYEVRLRYATSWMASIGLTILWFFPVTFVGLLSNISQLCSQVKWLDWVCRAPTPVPGILQGILSPMFLSISFAILPWFLRALAWYENIPLYSLLSISVYKRYYPFLVIHGFLVVTLSSGLTATASDIINSPTRTVSQLASHLPDASVFFLTWTVTQGLTGAGGALLQAATLFIHYIRKWFFGRTPRQAYTVTFLMPSADFGAILAQMSLLATIGFAYSILSPIINGLATLAFALFYLAWKFLLNWVFDQPDEQESGGLYFPIVLQNLFVGLYIEHICLAALFFLKAPGSKFFLALGTLMVILLAITVGAQLFFQQAFDPLSTYLPMSLATKRMQARAERHMRRREGRSEHEEEELDIFHREYIKSIVRRRILKPAAKVEHRPSRVSQRTSQHLEPPREASGSGLHHAHSHSSIHEHTHGSQHGGSGLHRAHSHSSIHEHHSSHTHGSQHGSRASRTSPSHRSPPLPAPHTHHTHATPSSVAGQQEEYEEDSDWDFDDYGFDHPSSYAEQPWIWIPKDELGMSEVLVAELRAGGVDASDMGSVMDHYGNVEVMRNPPDEAWTGGNDV